MKSRHSALGIGITVCTLIAVYFFKPQSTHALRASVAMPASPIQAYFSPKGGCTEAVVNTLNAAKKNIYVQAYSFTSKAIAAALVEAHQRGVIVHIILDKSQRGEKYSSADFVAHAGIDTYIDSKHAIAHNKVMIVDDATLITGSFNFTSSAENSNAENLLIIQSVPLAQQYLANWENHLSHSEHYEGR